MTKDHIE